MPDILLLTVDCLRWSDRAVLMDQISPGRLPQERSRHFANASFTAGAMKSLFAGELPLEGGSGLRPSDGSVALAQVLREAGYRTIGVHSNPLLAQPSFGRGFDAYQDLARRDARGLAEQGRRFVEKALGRLDLLGGAHVDAHEMNRTAFQLIAGVPKEQPLFCWVHYMDAHFPYGLAWRGLSPVDTARRKRFLRGELAGGDLPYWRTRYLDRLTSVGMAVREMLSAFQQLRGERAQVVVLTADHGEAFLEHGFVSHEAYLFDELVHVPMYSSVPLPSDTATITSHIDLYCDIVEVAGLKPGAARSGAHVQMEIFGDLMADSGSYIVGGRSPRWKVIKDSARTAVFDLTRDPGELAPREAAGVEDDEAAEVLELVERRYSELAVAGASGPAAEPELSDDALVNERLRALGYLE